VGKPATDIFWCPRVAQPGEHRIHKLIVSNPIWLMRKRPPFRPVMLGLFGKMEAVLQHPGVELVAQIWSQVRMATLRRPEPAPEFKRNREPVTAHPLGNSLGSGPSRKGPQSRFGRADADAVNFLMEGSTITTSSVVAFLRTISTGFMSRSRHANWVES